MATQADPESLHRVFCETEEWEFMRERLILRLQQVIWAIETSSEVYPSATPLPESFFKWAIFIKRSMSKESLPAEAHISLWAFLFNCQFVMEDIVRLCSAVDCLQQNVRQLNDAGPVIGLFPVIFPPSRAP